MRGYPVSLGVSLSDQIDGAPILGIMGLHTDITMDDSSEYDCIEIDGTDFRPNYSDDNSADDDDDPSFHLSSRSYLCWDDWLNLSVDIYDLFDSSFPRDSSDTDWGMMATRFIKYNLQAYEGWNLMLDFFCEPFSNWGRDIYSHKNLV